MTDALPMLTDVELLTVYHTVPNPYGGSTLSILKAIEAAVHAKLLSYFAQQEREAERAAVRDYANCFGGSSTLWLDGLYPSLTPQPSREIALSSGYVYRRYEKVWQVKAVAGPEPRQWVSASQPHCATAADHDKCAELLRLEEQ